MASRQINRQKVIDAMPGTQTEIALRSGVSRAAVCRWLADIMECKDAHIFKYSYHENGGKLVSHYKAGPRLDDWRPKKPKKTTDAERVARYRKKQRASGDWEDKKKKERDKYWLTKKPKVDILNALFGN